MADLVISTEDFKAWGWLVAIIISGISVAFSLWSNLRVSWYQNELSKNLEEHKMELETHRRRLERHEGMTFLMERYKKPLVLSAFDLQSRLKEQVTRELLSTFARQEDRRKKYIWLSTAYLIGEFLGWLEVIRKEVVFVTGNDSACTLNQIIDAIKYQFSGEASIQGVPKEDDRESSGKEGTSKSKWSVLQLFGVELRAIGEAMVLKDRDKQDDLVVMGYAEFSRKMMPWVSREISKSNHGSDSSPATSRSQQQGNISDDKSKDPLCRSPAELSCSITAGPAAPASTGDANKSAGSGDDGMEDSELQLTFKPLMASIKQLMDWPKKAAGGSGQQHDGPPTERIAMLQVLLCKLIDFLDSGQERKPAAAGGRRQKVTLEEERYLKRDQRITPVVAYLRKDAIEWLATQPFMEACEHLVHQDAQEAWNDEITTSRWMGFDAVEKDMDDEFRRCLKKLSFPGFREDLLPRDADDAAAVPRDAAKAAAAKKVKMEKLGTLYFPGAFPPRAPETTSVTTGTKLARQFFQEMRNWFDDKRPRNRCHPSVTT